MLKDLYMFKLLRVLFIIFITAFILSACVTPKQIVSKAGQKPPKKVVLPDRLFTSDKSTPIDIKMISAAVINKLRKRGNTRFVSFTQIANQNVQEKNFDYEGFEVTSIDITGFEANQVKKKQVNGFFEGVLHFKDYVERRANVYFAVKYIKTPKGITIQRADTTIIPPLYPRVQAFFIPAETFNKVRKKKFKGFYDKYAFAIGNGLDMNPNKKEIDEYLKYQKLPVFKKITARRNIKEAEFVVMILCLDRLSTSTKYKVEVVEGASKNLMEPKYINEKGWPITVLSGKFVLDNWSSPFDINVFYTPVSKRRKLLIGKFSNQKDYSPYTKTQKGALSSGSVILNPSNRKDARIIQSRLSELGYYNIAIDGAFGKGSRKSLQKFKKENNLNNDSNWDIKTQKALFKGTKL
jgi:Putative peptidoglycan binding domain